MVSINANAVNGLTNEEAASAEVVLSSITKQLLAGTHRYWEYMAPPATPTVLPISSLALTPASTTTPDPSLPACIGWSKRGVIAFISAGRTFIEATVSSPEPDTVRLPRSAAKVVSSARSDGLIGAASTLISTSLSDGLGIATLAIEIVISPALVTVEIISFDICSDMLIYPFGLCS